MGSAIAFALQAMNMLPAILKGVNGAIDAYNAAKAVITDMASSGRDPTAAEWDTLNAATDKLRSELHTDDPPPA